MVWRVFWLLLGAGLIGLGFFVRYMSGICENNCSDPDVALFVLSLPGAIIVIVTVVLTIIAEWPAHGPSERDDVDGLAE